MFISKAVKIIGVSHDERTLAALTEGTPADAETLLKQLQSTEAKAAATVVWFEDNNYGQISCVFNYFQSS